jgi:N-glycosylase/DNA lyase
MLINSDCMPLPSADLGLVEFSLRQEELNLPQTLSSGQAFRWREVAPGWWFGFLSNRPVWLRHEKGVLSAHGLMEPPSRSELEQYFDLQTPIAEVIQTFPAEDEVLHAAVMKYSGLRVLRQDPWETLLSFILSSNKRILHIQQCIEHLCRNFGPRFDLATRKAVVSVYGWPTPDVLAKAGEDALRACALGYRAPFVSALARMLDSGKIQLSKPFHLEYPAAREYLMQIPGVGPKVADCVLLFAYNHPEAFPVDVWIDRVLRKYYTGGKPLRDRDKPAFVCRRFGPCAGYAQQYLFHWARCCLNDLEHADRPG